MITSAQRAAPSSRVNSMLGPKLPRSPARKASVQGPPRTSSMLQYSRVSSLQASQEFQEDLIGHPHDRQNSVRLLHRKTSSRLQRGSMKQKLHFVKEAAIKKLTSHQQWVDKIMRLSEDSLTISDADASTDFIPLHEITDVSLSQAGMSSVEELEETEQVTGEKKSKGFSSLTAKMRGPSAGKQPVQQSQVFDVFTTHDGRNSGRTYTFMAATSQEGEDWIQLLTKMSRERIKFVRQQTQLEKWRERARDIYNSWAMQSFVAFLIFANFAINAVQAEFHPKTMTHSDSAQAHTYLLLDVILTMMFVAELVFNGFGHWFWPFVLDAWNWFDVFIVLLSLISILVPAVPGLNILRVLRAFRLLRLIRRFRSLKKIFDALVLSIIPVLNAFLIGVLITMIYTIIGVFLFSEQSYENFGTFNRSLHTLFMLIATGDWPAEDIQPFDRDGKINKPCDVRDRPRVYRHASYAARGSETGHFRTCIQVVVAVLLDNFLSVTQDEKRAEAIAAELATANHHMMDPLLQKLVDNFESEEDLKRDIMAVFKIVDVDNSGTITDQEMLEGFAKLQLTPRIRLSPDDCKAIKEHSLGLINDEELDADMFEQMMRRQLHSFVQRRMHDAFVHNEDPSVVAILAGLKLVLAQNAPTEREGEGGQHRNADDVDWRLAAIQKEQLTSQAKVSKVEAKVDDIAEQVRAMRELMEQGFARMNGRHIQWPSIHPFGSPPSSGPEKKVAHADQTRAAHNEPQQEPVPSYLDSFELKHFALSSPLDSFGFATVKQWVSPASETEPASNPVDQESSNLQTLQRASSVVSRAMPTPATIEKHNGVDLDWNTEAKTEEKSGSASSSASESARKARERFQVVDTEWLQMAHDRAGSLTRNSKETRLVPATRQERQQSAQQGVGVDMVMIDKVDYL